MCSWPAISSRKPICTHSILLQSQYLLYLSFMICGFKNPVSDWIDLTLSFSFPPVIFISLFHLSTFLFYSFIYISLLLIYLHFSFAHLSLIFYLILSISPSINIYIFQTINIFKISSFVKKLYTRSMCLCVKVRDRGRLRPLLKHIVTYWVS